MSGSKTFLRRHCTSFCPGPIGCRHKSLSRLPLCYQEETTQCDQSSSRNIVDLSNFTISQNPSRYQTSYHTSNVVNYLPRLYFPDPYSPYPYPLTLQSTYHSFWISKGDWSACHPSRQQLPAYSPRYDHMTASCRH